jgi:dihydropteroate synthase
MIWHINGRDLDLTHKSHIMGILNATPDSFSDGGHFDSITSAIDHARSMIHDGASIIDIGGESTRPGSLEVPPDIEISRTIPVIQALRKEWNGFISIDTKKASVAQAALLAGADIVNDVSGLTADPDMPALCASNNCGIVIMHMHGTPATMQINPHYDDLLLEVSTFFQNRLTHLSNIGIHPSRLCFDPGIGFGKTLEHNLTLLNSLQKLAPKNRPILLGASRKSFLGTLCNLPNPVDRDAATTAITTLARKQNIMLHRVHNVPANLQALKTTEALFNTEKGFSIP